MDKNSNMYQASDGRWYPVSQMPPGWTPNQQGFQQQPGYGAQPQMHYGQQPIVVQQPHSSGGGAAGGAAAGGAMGCLAAMCAACLCFDLGMCLF